MLEMTTSSIFHGSSEIMENDGTLKFLVRRRHFARATYKVWEYVGSENCPKD
jgi:hypothetical protein